MGHATGCNRSSRELTLSFIINCGFSKYVKIFDMFISDVSMPSVVDSTERNEYISPNLK